MAVAQGLMSPPPAMRGRLALAAADTFVCLWLASLWLIIAASPAVAIGYRAGDRDRPVFHVAWAVSFYAAFPSYVVCSVAILLLIRCVPRSDAEEEKASSNAPEMDDLDDAVIYGLPPFLAFLVLGLVGGMVNASLHKGSLGERISLAIMGLGFGGMSSFACLVVIPTMALMLWRMRRSGWRWGSKFEEKPSRGESAVQMGKEPQVLTIC